MDGFNPSWFIAVGIGLLFIWADFMIPEGQRRRVGHAALALGVLSLFVGFGGLGWDAWQHFWPSRGAPNHATKQSTADAASNVKIQPAVPPGITVPKYSASKAKPKRASHLGQAVPAVEVLDYFSQDSILVANNTDDRVFVIDLQVGIDSPLVSKGQRVDANIPPHEFFRRDVDALDRFTARSVGARIDIPLNDIYYNILQQQYGDCAVIVFFHPSNIRLKVMTDFHSNQGERFVTKMVIGKLRYRSASQENVKEQDVTLIAAAVLNRDCLVTKGILPK